MMPVALQPSVLLTIIIISRPLNTHRERRHSNSAGRAGRPNSSIRIHNLKPKRYRVALNKCAVQQPNKHRWMRRIRYLAFRWHRSSSEKEPRFRAWCLISSHIFAALVRIK